MILIGFYFLETVPNLLILAGPTNGQQTCTVYTVAAVCFPAFVLRSISDDKKVDYPGGEVQSHVCFTVDHCYTVSIAIAGSRHATAEQQERGPACTHRVKFSSVYSKINV